MSEIQIGNTYQVRHTRKGNFQMRVTGIGSEFVDGVVTDGVAGAMLEYNEVHEDEEITVRASFCTFTLIEAQS